MYQNEFEDITHNNEVFDFLNQNRHPQSAETELITELLQQRSNKVAEEITKGDLNIFDPHEIKDQISKLQRQIKKKEKQLQEAIARHDDRASKQLKRQIIKLRQQESSLTKEEAKLKKKQILERVKKWEEIQSEIRSKKEQLDAEKLKQQNESAQKLKKEELQAQRKKRLQRKAKIQKKLSQIQSNRARRQQIIRFAEAEYQKLQPKYVQIEKKYQQTERQIKFEEQIIKKNHKLSTLVDYNAIKAHQKQYMTKVSERNHHRSLKTSSVEQHKSQFTPFIFRDEAKIQSEKQKFKRRQQFEERLKEIPIPTDEAITLRVEVERDRGKNPLKYHFLGEKALSKEQIYKQFPTFQLNLNPKQLGVDYLKSLPNITQNSRITKSHSQSSLTKAISTRQRYKDYLHDLKLSRPPRSQLSTQDIVKLSTSNGNKSKILDALAKKERVFSLQLQKRQEQLEKYNNVKTSLKKIQQIDEIYSQSIKTKLAHLELRQ